MNKTLSVHRKLGHFKPRDSLSINSLAISKQGKLNMSKQYETPHLSIICKTMSTKTMKQWNTPHQNKSVPIKNNILKYSNRNIGLDINTWQHVKKSEKCLLEQIYILVMVENTQVHKVWDDMVLYYIYYIYYILRRFSQFFKILL